MKFDCIIIGNGPAGVTCGIYLKRFGHNVLIIGKDNGALEKAESIENVYALGSMSGKDIISSGIKQALNLGVSIAHDEVLGIEYAEEGYKVVATKMEYSAPYIVIATGKARNSFQLAKKYEGLGVSYCATCDGFFYRNKPIALVGYNDYMKHELEHLSNLTKDITIYTNGNKLQTNVGDFKVIEEKITALKGDQKFSGIITENTDNDYAGCFIALGSANAFSLAKHLGLEIDDKNNLVVDNLYMTNIDGIYAVGDVIGGVLQITKASYDGMMAAYAINNKLRGKK